MEALREHVDSCPYCAERITLLIDATQAGEVYVEDCFVCCQPIVVSLVEAGSGELQIQLASEND